MVKVYPCGYSVHSAQIAALMEADSSLLLVDLRKSPDSRIPAWKSSRLRTPYGQRYGWFGETLGNLNYKTGGPVRLANPGPGIACLVRKLQQGHNLLLLCGCANFETCHRREVVTLLKQAIPEIEVVFPDEVTHTGTAKTISIRQPWTWLICNPQIVKDVGLPAKDIENREWTTNYRGLLYIHAGSAVDSDLFDRGELESYYWTWKFGDAGRSLYEAMPRHKDDYPLRAIVGRAQLTDVVTSSQNPWFNGPYGLVLADVQAIAPVSYSGSLKLFDVPAAILQEKEASASSR